MKFEKDLFISYAHLDNKPLTAEQQGWITRFHESLEAMLSMRMGGKAVIWRDEKLRGSDVIADEIIAQFPLTALLVSILTPRYLNSEWCTREVNEFCKCAKQSGGVIVGNKARIIKVIKTPIGTEKELPDVMKELPDVMQDLKGYDFFTFEEEAPLELDPVYGEKFAHDFNRKIGILAFDLAEQLKKLKTENDTSKRESETRTPDMAGGPAEESPGKPIVYLAECSIDRREAREILEGDLKRHGYKVLPDQPMPREEEEYVATVKRLLDQCALSIHLVGELYGAVPDGHSQKSVVELQNEIAIKKSKSDDLKRLIWLPAGTGSEWESQKNLIEALHRDAEAQYGADLITGDFEELKSAVHAALKRSEGPTSPPPPSSSSPLIFIVCDQKDRKATIPVRRFFKDKGFEVDIPAFKGDAKAVREANQRLLKSCDAVLLFYGAGDEAWKRTIDNDLKKVMGYRAGKPLKVSYTYLAGPKTIDKEEMIAMEEPNLIDGVEGFSEPLMESFIQAIASKGAAS